MSTSKTSRVPLDAPALERLAQRPAQPLFGTLRKAEAMRPLLVLVAIIPPLLIATWQPFSTSVAEQGLAALNVWQSLAPHGWLDPTQGTPCAGQPPLYSWCLAAMMQVLHPGSLLVFPFTTALGVGLYVWSGATLARLASGDRGALVAALLLASNPLTIAQGMHLGPAPLGAGLALLSLVWLLEDWRHGGIPWSWRRLAGGIALGGSLLSAPAAGLGALLLALVLILGTTIGWKWALGGQHPSESRLGPGGWGRVWGGLLWATVALFLAGWWLMEIPRLTDRSTATAAAAIAKTVAEPTLSVTGRMLQGGGNRLLGSAYLLWLLIPWCALAADRSTGVSRTTNVRSRGTISPLGRSVALGATIVLLCLGPGADGVAEEVWGAEGLRLFLLAPITAVASAGAVRLMDRQVGWQELSRSVLGGAIAGWIAWKWGGLVVWRSLEVTSRGMGIQLFVLLSVTAWLLLVAVVWRRANRMRSDRIARALVLLGWGVLGGGSVLWGISHLGPRTQGAARDFQDLRSWVRQLDGTRPIHLVAPRERVPSEIAYAVRSLWPRVTASAIVDWNRFRGLDSGTRAGVPFHEGETILAWFPPESPRGGGVPEWLSSAGPSLKYLRGELAWYRLVGSSGDGSRPPGGN